MRREQYKTSLLCIGILIFAAGSLSWLYFIFWPEWGYTLFWNASRGKNVSAENDKFDRDLTAESSMMSRARYARRMCQQVDWNSSLVKARPPVFFYSKPNGLLACKSPKTGSTFIGTLIRAFNVPNDNKVADVFLIGRNTIHSGLNEVSNWTVAHILKHPTLTVMITRNPFARLYSVFIDKYFLLGRLGRELASHLKRGLLKKKGSYCGYDLTFQDFLDYVVYLAQTKKEINEHMAPVTQLCDVCKSKYDLIGRQENLTGDTEELLSLMTNTTSNRLNIIRQCINNSSAYAPILTLLYSHVFDYSYYRKDCPNKMHFMANVWKTFQVQGLVHSLLNFPEQIFSQFAFVKKEVHNITSAILQVTQALPLSSKERKLQRLYYQATAYRDIRWQTIVNLQKVFEMDFLLFGYSSYPLKYYNITQPKKP